jgi:Flp pilus assembly pilin Flp
MLWRFRRENNQAQIFLEYTVICGLVVMVLFSMNVMIKRGIQGMVKSVADQIGSQENSEQGFSEAGYLESQYVSTRASMDKRTRELLGATNYLYQGTITTSTETVSNLGFTEE